MNLLIVIRLPTTKIKFLILYFSESALLYLNAISQAMIRLKSFIASIATSSRSPPT